MHQKLSLKILAERQKRGVVILKILKKLFPDARIFLTYGNHWELLVAVILSAQCTDKMVNQVTPALFQKYRTLEDYVKAKPREFEKMVFKTGFYRNKTKNILAAARVVTEKFHGKIPRTMAGMLIIPGVARKTANVVLGNAYGIVEGIAVDTHVRRLSQKLELTTENDPNKIEQDLMQIFPKKEWFALTYRLIEYGRKYCSAKKHNHTACPLSIALGARFRVRMTKPITVKTKPTT